MEVIPNAVPKFQGIITQLVYKHHRQIHDHGIIQITSKSFVTSDEHWERYLQMKLYDERSIMSGRPEYGDAFDPALPEYTVRNLAFPMDKARFQSRSSPR
jgi:hypothetical protein